jgi:molybdate transport system substrate-binding protein
MPFDRRNPARLRGPLAVLLFTLAITLFATAARADEIHVMVSGGFTAAYRILVEQWQKTSGHTVTTVYGASMGSSPTSIPNRLERGEAADVVILARMALDGLVRDGKVVEHSQVDLARSRIAMAVKAGANKPDISSEARFKQVLLAAPSIAYSDSASGVYISSELFQKLGIAEQVAGKAHRIAGMPVGEAVARGEVAIGFQQLSELLPVRGITIVGPIPDAVQLITIFSAGVSSSSRTPAVARELIGFLSSKPALNTIRRSGLDTK